MNQKAVAGTCGAIASVIAFAVLYQLGSNRFTADYARALGREGLAAMNTNLLIGVIPSAISVGVACALLVLIGRLLWEPGRLDRLARGAVAGVSWILVLPFVQTSLLYARANVSSIPANLFWSGSRVLAMLAVVAFVVRTLTRQSR